MNKIFKILTIAALICAFCIVPALGEENNNEGITGWNPVDGFTGIFAIPEEEPEEIDQSAGIVECFGGWGSGETETFIGEEIIIDVIY